jgi:N-acetylmuramoyl-L-alanine amidase
LINGVRQTTTAPKKVVQTKQIVDKNKKDLVVFKVQIETSEKSVAYNHPKFKGETVSEYKQDGLYKYTAGNFENNFDKANEHKREMRNKGFKHAFVVAFVNGERISLEKAINLAKK